MSDDRAIVAHEVGRVADRLFDTIAAGDLAGAASTFADDIRVRHTGDRRDQTKTEAVAVIAWFIDVTSERRYEDARRNVFAGGFVQQHTLRGTSNSGARFDARVCIVVNIDPDGRISRIDEYFDIADYAPLFGDDSVATA